MVLFFIFKDKLLAAELVFPGVQHPGTFVAQMSASTYLIVCHTWLVFDSSRQLLKMVLFASQTFTFIHSEHQF